MRREIRHVARQGYRDFEGIPTRPTDRATDPDSSSIRSRAAPRRHRGSLHSAEPFLAWRRWCRTIGQIGRRQRAPPASIRRRGECLTRVAVRRREGKSALFPLPSFLPSHLSSCPSSLLFSVSVFGGTGKQASEQGRERKGRSVGRHRRPLFSSEVGRAEEIKKCYRVAVAVVLDGVGPERAFPNRRLCEGGIGLITD